MERTCSDVLFASTGVTKSSVKRWLFILRALSYAAHYNCSKVESSLLPIVVKQINSQKEPDL
jgi:hypothetical protein